MTGLPSNLQSEFTIVEIIVFNDFDQGLLYLDGRNSQKYLQDQAYF